MRIIPLLFILIYVLNDVLFSFSNQKYFANRAVNNNHSYINDTTDKYYVIQVQNWISIYGSRRCIIRASSTKARTSLGRNAWNFWKISNYRITNSLERFSREFSPQVFHAALEEIARKRRKRGLTLRHLERPGGLVDADQSVAGSIRALREIPRVVRRICVNKASVALLVVCFTIAVQTCDHVICAALPPMSQTLQFYI